MKNNINKLISSLLFFKLVIHLLFLVKMKLFLIIFIILSNK